MNLHEEVSRIKSMMGVITEDEVTFPIIKSGSYTAPLGNCDRLHAFNDTKSGPVGKMNDIVNPILLDVYNKGFNPDIIDIDVEITRGSEYTVNWSVTINESTDGNAWTGLYSRGHGGGADWVFSDVSTTEGHASIEACKTSNYIKKRGTVDKMVLVKDYEFNKDGKIPGCRVNQLFYKYTLEEYPTLEEKIEDVIIKPEDDEDTLEPSTNKVDGIPYNKTMIDNPDF
jgi:hypothetical protein